MKILRRFTFSLFIFAFIGCEAVEPSSEDDTNNIIMTIEPRLDVDENGYYHLMIDRNNWQTIHRVSGHLNYENGSSAELIKVYWSSNLYWYLGDTLGYIVKRGLTAQLEYVTYDTIYVTGFNGMEVPTINPASYSNGDGEFNQMFAPVKSMRGDTVTVTVARQDYFGEWQGVEFYVVLD